MKQADYFQQFTNVICSVAISHPLLLLIDDMQWADTGSISLLFHLGRRLKGHRICIVCAFRPDEVAAGRDGDPHPLEKLLAEFKRIWGDVSVELGELEKGSGRQFVDAYLDSWPNRLAEGFRAALTAHTGGHPLFTIELLRSLQERREITQDEEGLWVAAKAVDWSKLPVRVEAVIEERVGRLERDLLEILTVASVEGERFSAQGSKSWPPAAPLSS